MNELILSIVNNFYNEYRNDTNAIVENAVNEFYCKLYEEKDAEELQKDSEYDRNESFLDRVVSGESNEMNNLLRSNTPIIYAFFTEHVPDMIKIGFTDQGALTRLKQWKNYYPDAKLLGYWTSMEFNDANKRVFFKDYPVHARTNKRGFKQITDIEKEDFRNLAINSNLKDAHISREFFHKYRNLDADQTEELSAEIIEDIIKELKNDIRNNNAIDIDLYELLDNGTTKKADKEMPEPKTFTLTDLQKQCIDNGVKAIKEGKTDLLMACCMRFGKTSVSYHIISESGLKYVVVTSAKADVRTSWRNDINHIDLYKDFAFVEFTSSGNFVVSMYDKEVGKVTTVSWQNEDTIQQLRDMGKTVIVFATLSDLKGKHQDVESEIIDNNGNTLSVKKRIHVIKDKHKYIFENAPELVIIDESHFGSHSKTQGAAVGLDDPDQKEVSEDENKEHEELRNLVHNMHAKCRLQCSGTPYYILKSGEFGTEYDNKTIIADVSYTDMLNARDQWIKDHPNMPESNSPYFGIPNLIKIGMDLTKKCRKCIASKANLELGLNELFKVRDRKFIHEDAITELMESIFGSNGKQMPGFLDQQKIKDGEIFKHIMMVLPTVDACHVLRQLLVDKNIINTEERKPIVLVERKTKAAQSFKYDPEGKDSDTLDAEMRRLESEGKRSVCFTVYKMLTGVTLPLLDAMFYLKGSQSAQEYDQSVFRLCSRNTAKAIDKNGNVETINRKDNVYLIDFAIDRMFKMAVQSAAAQGIAKGLERPDDIQDIMEENLHNMPMFTEHIYDGSGRKVLNTMKEVQPKDLLKLFAKYNKNKSIDDAIADSIKFDKFKGFLGNVDNLELVRHFSTEGLSTRNLFDYEGSDIIDIADPSKGNMNNMPAESVNKKSNKKDGNTPTPEQKKLLNELESKFKNMLKRLMYSCICLDGHVRCVDDYIEMMKTDALTRRICSEFMIDQNVIEQVYESLDAQEKMSINMIMVQIDELLNDDELAPIDRVMNCVSKLGKMDDSEVVTPQKLCERIIAKIDDTQIKDAKSILLINEKYGEFLIALYRKFGADVANKCQIVPSSKIGKRLCMKMVKTLGLDMKNILNIDDYNKKVPGYDIQDWLFKPNDKILSEDNNMAKYSVILANPPFNGTLHQKFEAKFFDICDGDICWISPAAFLLGKKQYKPITDNFDKYGAEIETVNGNECFEGPAIGGTMGIFHVNMNGEYHNAYYDKSGNINFDGKNYAKSEDISLTSNDELLDNLKNKIIGISKDNVINYIKNTPYAIHYKKHTENNPNENWWCLRISGIRGHGTVTNPNDDFYTLFSNDNDEINKFLGQYKDMKNIVSKNGKKYLEFYWAFDTKNELYNFHNYLKTYFTRFCLYLGKQNNDLFSGQPMLYIPWQDFTQEWDDYKLFKKYNITKEEIEKIYSILPNYYNIKKINLDGY